MTVTWLFDDDLLRVRAVEKQILLHSLWLCFNSVCLNISTQWRILYIILNQSVCYHISLLNVNVHMPCALFLYFSLCREYQTEPALLDVFLVDVTFGFPYNVRRKYTSYITCTTFAAHCTEKTNNHLTSKLIGLFFSILSTNARLSIIPWTGTTVNSCILTF
jgi:hypothetical protein